MKNYLLLLLSLCLLISCNEKPVQNEQKQVVAVQDTIAAWDKKQPDQTEPTDTLPKEVPSAWIAELLKPSDDSVQKELRTFLLKQASIQTNNYDGKGKISIRQADLDEDRKEEIFVFLEREDAHSAMGILHPSGQQWYLVFAESQSAPYGRAQNTYEINKINKVFSISRIVGWGTGVCSLEEGEINFYKLINHRVYLCLTLMRFNHKLCSGNDEDRTEQVVEASTSFLPNGDLKVTYRYEIYHLIESQSSLKVPLIEGKEHKIYRWNADSLAYLVHSPKTPLKVEGMRGESFDTIPVLFKHEIAHLKKYSTAQQKKYWKETWWGKK